MDRTQLLAQVLAQTANAGRGGDEMLAHVTPEEARLLMLLGGAGTTNPQTGLPEFYGATGEGSNEGAQGVGGVGGTDSGWGGGGGQSNDAGAYDIDLGIPAYDDRSAFGKFSSGYASTSPIGGIIGNVRGREVTPAQAMGTLAAMGGPLLGVPLGVVAGLNAMGVPSSPPGPFNDGMGGAGVSDIGSVASPVSGPGAPAMAPAAMASGPVTYRRQPSGMELMAQQLLRGGV